MKALLVSGDRSGSGKTSITLALASLLSQHHTVQTFKVGMDYIDPSYLSAVTDRPCRNLDGFVMGLEDIRTIFAHGCRGADVALIEGVRGLFEGAESLSDAGSTAGIAKALDLPVVLVLNARSITRSAAAIVCGFRDFDPSIRIRGVILNNIGGESHRRKATEAIEHFCGIPVLGAIPHAEGMALEMRHLGLIPYLEGREDRAFDDRLGVIRDLVGEHVDMDRLLACADDRPPAGRESTFLDRSPEPDLTIGIARDQAFNFYYEDLFDVLRAGGARTVTFSPVEGKLPDADGYIIGGGYPELFLPELAANQGMREGIREVAAQGIPLYAECGGLMYLTERIVSHRSPTHHRLREGTAEMCGVFPGETLIPARRVVSYVEGEASAESPLGPARFRGHEFHYSDVVLDEGTRFAYRLTRGVGIREAADGALVHRAQGSYTHLHPVASREMFG
ncbi:MAG: Ni-sirohydrochlorin a,c-diamide synthase, partial [Methanomicrobiales archaeon]|nr:Ni-sirohydrochlorin a,c-diamide synthase [Methanomicrobiales archaeon]